MGNSLIARFVDAFIGGFFKTMKEKLIDLGLLGATLLYWLFSRKLSAHLWESLAPWVWVLCGIVAWHTVSAAHLLLKELKQEQLSSRHRERSLILSQYGEPLELPKAEVETYRAKIVGIVGAVILLCAICSYGVHRIAKTEEGVQPPIIPPQPALAIFAECDISGMPITIPPHARLRLVPVNPRRMKATQWGSYDVPNDTDKNQQWPSKKLLDESAKKHDFGSFVYKCEVSNHSQVNVLDVAIPMRFWFGNKGGEENAIKFTRIISPLDAGHSVVLYFVNDCPTSASGVLPDEASLLVVGETERRTTRLNLPHRNPTDPIMMWFPTTVRWISGEPCE